MMRFAADIATVLKQNSFSHFLLDVTVGLMKEVQRINVTQCHYKQPDKLWALIRRKSIASSLFL